MKIRLGYVATALRLQDCSPSKTTTLKNIQKINGYKNQVNRLINISFQNLENTLRILKANFYDHIYIYRFSSRLIPLATHPQFLDWDYRQSLRNKMKEIGEYVQEKHMRVGFHPDHFTLLNSPIPEVQASSLRDLEFHTAVLEEMQLTGESKLVIHVGGKYNNKKAAIERFQEQFQQLPSNIKQLIILENDDRCFSAAEVLDICRELSIPMVLDLHHHQLLNHGESIDSLLPQIFNTWGTKTPKVHISSPRDEKDPRAHADYVDVSTVTDFLEKVKPLNREFDIMLEAKQKDLALLKLAADLKEQGFNLPANGEIIL